jgi:hypothetical protein
MVVPASKFKRHLSDDDVLWVAAWKTARGHAPESVAALQPSAQAQPSWDSDVEQHRSAVRHDFADVFPDELPGLPPARDIDHRIDLVDESASPPSQRPYRLSHAEAVEMDRQLADLAARGFIRHSSSPYGAPVLFVRKKDGALRMCVDYRQLNANTVKNRYPLPRIDDLLTRLAGKKWFSKLDLRSGYHQVRVTPEHIERTAFRTPTGHYEFTVLPFGLTNAPATFMRMMHDALGDLLRDCCVAYLDDILIFSDTLEQHDRHVRLVLSALRQRQLFVNPKKCLLFAPAVEFLGHLVGTDGVRPLQDKIAAVRDWPAPTSVAEVRVFLGFANYYRHFVARFAIIARPITDLLRGLDKTGDPTAAINWTPERDEAFKQLKQALTSAPVLAHPIPGTGFFVQIDASALGIGAVLAQCQSGDKRPRPIAFFSRRLSTIEGHYNSYELELLAAREAMRTWRHLLVGERVVVFTDNQALTHLPSKRELLGRKESLFAAELAEFDVVFRYKRRELNVAADALSRLAYGADVNPLPGHIDDLSFEAAYRQGPPATVAAIGDSIMSDPDVPARSIVSLLVPAALRASFVEGYRADPLLGPAYAALLSGAASFRCWGHNLVLADDRLIYTPRGQLCVPTTETLRQALLHDHHDALSAAHFGVAKMSASITRHYFWPGLRSDIKRWVASCHSCKRSKSDNRKPAGLLQPLPIPGCRWQSVAMDLVIHLPVSEGYDAIVSFTDRLTKRVHFAPCHTSSSAPDLSRIYVREVFRLHGSQGEFVSDRDSRFTSEFWQSFFKAAGVRLAMSTSRHPQTDGQSERNQRTLEEILRAHANYHMDNWVSLLSWAEFAYNSSVHPSIGMPPFVADLGFLPSTPQSLLAAPGQPPRADAASAQLFQHQAAEALELAKRNLQRAQDRQAVAANRNRRAEEFQVGDQVFLRAAHIRPAYEAGRPTQKLGPKFLGPFLVTGRVGNVAYRLDLSSVPGLRVHPVFHVAELRRVIPNPFPGRVDAPPPPVVVDDHEEHVVSNVVDWRWNRRSKRVEYLTTWAGEPLHTASWLPLENLRGDDGVTNESLLRFWSSQTGLQQFRPDGMPSSLPFPIGIVDTDEQLAVPSPLEPEPSAASPSLESVPGPELVSSSVPPNLEASQPLLPQLPSVSAPPPSAETSTPKPSRPKPLVPLRAPSSRIRQIKLPYIG